MKPPIFSIVIPAHNEEEYIVQVLDSIYAQDFPIVDIEIIVINDNSTDRTLEIVDEYAANARDETINVIKILNVKKGSAAGARNAGIIAARGKYVLFQDADCFADPCLLNNAAKWLDNLDIDGLATRTTNVKPSNWIQRAVAVQRAMRWENTYNSPIIKYLDSNSGINVAIMKRSVLERLGGFDETIFYYEDNDLTKRFFEQEYKAIFGRDVIQYHNDPISLRESFEQCKNIAKGLRIKRKHGMKLTCTEWFSLFSRIIPPVDLITFIIILIIGYNKTKDLKGSFYLGILLELRSLAKLYYFLTRWKV